jgi:hypothetical protein
MMESRWIALALLAIALIGSARLLWQQRRGPRRSGLHLAALLALQIAVSVLLYVTLVPPLTQARADRLTVLTAGADKVQWSAASGDTVVALPEAAPSTATAVPDLATALRLHPGTQSLRVIGDGLPARDRDISLPGQVHLLQPAPPRGWHALQAPAITAPGGVFDLHARAQGVAGASAELHDPAGIVVDRGTLGSDGSIVLAGVARASGRTTFSLRLLDASRHVVDSVPVPLQTLDHPAPRVLILAGAPGPELKYLRRWAVDTGLDVQLQASAGGGVSLGDAPVALTAARLAATDVLILDERSLPALGTAQRSAVQQALRDGLGVLVRTGGPLGDGARQALRGWGLAVIGNSQSTPLHLTRDPDAALLQARRGPQRPATQATAYIDEADAASHSAAVPVLEQFPLRGTNASALLHDDKGQPVGGWRSVGKGRLALLPVTDSYRLVLSGRDDRHAELWSGVLASVARPLPNAAQVRIDAPTPWAGERVALCNVPAAAQVRGPTGIAVPLHIDPATGTDRCAGYWPQQAGWHQVQQGDVTQAFYVFDPASAPTLYRQQQREANGLLVRNAQVGAVSGTVSAPGPRWPWLLAFVLVAGLLWWLERWRPRTVSPAP